METRFLNKTIIRMFAGNFAPQNWAFCQGQTLQIGQHQALFSIVGTTYGGNGTTSFNLPDLRGRVPVGVGHGEGLTTKDLGEKAGAETITASGTAQVELKEANLPSHTHAIQGDVKVSVADQAGSTALAAGSVLGKRSIEAGASLTIETYVPLADAKFIQKNKLEGISHNLTNAAVGSGLPVNAPVTINVPTIQPYLGINFIICLNGIYPSPQTILIEKNI